MLLTKDEIVKIIKEEVESSVQNPHELEVDDKVKLKYFVYAYPSMPTRAQMIQGVGEKIPAKHAAIIKKIKDEYAIVGINYKGKKMVAPVKLVNLEPFKKLEKK